MTYDYFLENIKEYVGKHARFTGIMKVTGERNTSCFKKIWDEKEFAPLKKDSLIEIISVEVV